MKLMPFKTLSVMLAAVWVGVSPVCAQSSIDPGIYPDRRPFIASQLARLRLQLTRLERQRLTALHEYTPNSPQVRRFDLQIAKVRQQIRQFRQMSGFKPNLPTPQRKKAVPRKGHLI